MMKPACTALVATLMAAAAVPAEAGGRGGHGGHRGPSINLGAIVNTAAKINVLNVVKARVGLGPRARPGHRRALIVRSSFRGGAPSLRRPGYRYRVTA